MFKRKEKRYLPKHIEYYQYHRDFRIKNTPQKDKTAIEEFYKLHNIKYKGLTTSQQNIIFKRTVNYIYIVAHFYDNKPQARIIAKLGPNKGFGVVRSRAFIFHKRGELLYELDHDYQEYPEVGKTTQVENKKVLKKNYELHEKLDNNFLKEIGKNTQNFVKFDKACHELLRQDDVHNSVDFITS